MIWKASFKSFYHDYPKDLFLNQFPLIVLEMTYDCFNCFINSFSLKKLNLQILQMTTQYMWVEKKKKNVGKNLIELLDCMLSCHVQVSE